MTIQAIRTTCKYQTFPCKNFLLQIFRIDLTKRDARVREEFRWDWSSFIGSQSQTTREPSISSGIILLVAQARGSLSLIFRWRWSCGCNNTAVDRTDWCLVSGVRILLSSGWRRGKCFQSGINHWPRLAGWLTTHLTARRNWQDRTLKVHPSSSWLISTLS